MNITIIGYGSFGQLLARLTKDAHQVSIVAHSPGDTLLEGVQSLDMQTACKQADILLLAVNLDVLESVCLEVAQYVQESTIVADVCSVKSRPAEILKTYLTGKCQFVATHPLFGPNSVPDNTAAVSQRLVWCDVGGGDTKRLRDLFELDLQLDVVYMTPEQHDREMAWVHALTFFVGRSLLHMDIPQTTLSTGYFEKLLTLSELESSHSSALFNTIQIGNPYAAEIRKQYLDQLQILDNEIAHGGLREP